MRHSTHVVHIPVQKKCSRRRKVFNILNMSFKSISNDLHKTIKDVELISEKFSSLTSDEERIRFCYNVFREKFRNLSFQRIGKSAEKSRKLRETGNDYFRKSDSWKAVNSYTESIANAPNNSEELSLAFGNRAATLLRLNLVTEALMDVEKALSMNITENFKTKMLERKKKCLKNVGNTRLICTDCEDVELSTKNSYFSSASAAVETKIDNIFGRSLVVCNDVKTGEILVVEKPFSSILVPNHFYTHCSWCFKRSFCLLPCPNCTTSMYCSEECLKQSRKSHKVQCNVLEILVSLQASTLELLSVKVLDDASEQGLKLNELVTEISEYDKNNNKQMSYKSNDHINIYKLVGNTEKRNICDLFQKSVTTCIIITVLDKFSEFFTSIGNKKHYFFEIAGGLILRYLQSMPCNAHEVSEFCDDGYEEIGAGVYATLSLINHSCDPNVVRHCHRDVIVLRAIRPIKKGEQLFDNYGYHYALLDIRERQIPLLKQYYFECTCEACSKNWPLQQNLPELKPVFKIGVDMIKYQLLTESFKKNVEDIFRGECENNVILELMDYLDFLDEYVERPWKAYNICQEAIKHCLGLRGNCFRLSKGVQKVQE